jgi:hypothetical protein
MTMRKVFDLATGEETEVPMTPEEVAQAAAVAASFAQRPADGARAALARSDVTVLRCVEAGVPVPADWRTYRQALRAVVSTGVGPVPVAPPYPEGT